MICRPFHKVTLSWEVVDAAAGTQKQINFKQILINKIGIWPFTVIIIAGKWINKREFRTKVSSAAAVAWHQGRRQGSESEENRFLNRISGLLFWLSLECENNEKGNKMCAGCGCGAERRLHGRGHFFFVAWLYFWGTFTFDREQSPSLYYCHHQKQKSSVVCNPIDWYRQLHTRTVLGQCLHHDNRIASPVIFRLFSIGMCRLTCRHSILICGQICDKRG